ncbi:SDR family NAD(P)-dependent oxidoreductase [uncultured Pseudokineococcus sp.]|uniref:SDR family NAD(P)-dependent oxidoreductase n=1 Tax=uncultured Pseudokineococcus sp. TaxID=1642928 RepID=UPI00260D7BE3|nr:SDR family oxidoreductase [uncultured Pseudokineococcus sp.]
MRHVLVTGAAGGIGRAVAERLSRDGWTVTGADSRAELLSQAMAPLPSARAEVVDLATVEGPEELLAAAAAPAPLDAVVNAAGVYPARPFLDLDAAAWDHVMAVDLRAPMLLTRAFAAAAVAAGRGGVVVNISSGAALRSRPGAAHYSTAKAALEVLTRSAALELGPHGIRVVAVSPGFVRVDSDVNPVTPEYAAEVSRAPLERAGTPEDVAAAVAFMLSEESSWITGTVLRVDGGSSAGSTTLPLHWSAANGTGAA